MYTRFQSTLARITTSEAGVVEDFTANLQGRLDAKLAQVPEAVPPFLFVEDEEDEAADSIVVDDDAL